MQGKLKMFLSKKWLRILALGVSLVLVLQYGGTLAIAVDDTQAAVVLEILDIEEHGNYAVEPGTLEEDLGLPETVTLLLKATAADQDMHSGQDVGADEAPAPEPESIPSFLPEAEPDAQDEPNEPVPATPEDPAGPTSAIEPMQAPAAQEPTVENQPEPTFQVVVPAIWQCDEYNGDLPGEYTFTLQLPSFYNYEGNLPTALVTVGLPRATEGEEPLSSNEEDTEPELVVYDAQPLTMEDVRACIDDYEARYAEALESAGEEAAILVPKARWEFEVEEEFMPEGYCCRFVTAGEDMVFGTDYYTFFTAHTWARSAMAQDGEGYWLITTPEELDQVREDLTAKYRLANDIDLTGYSGNNWAGIGDSVSQAFEGEVDGQNYTIRGLRSVPVNIYDTAPGKGLFRYTNGAYIHNLKLETASSAAANDYVLRARGDLGTLVGNANNSTIENCTVTLNGYMYCDFPNAGGLIGIAMDSTVKDCTITINGAGHSTYAIQNTTSATGGIIGSTSNTTIQNSNVEINGGIGNTGGPSVSNTGGIVGKAQDSTIENCTTTLNHSAAPYDLYAAMSQLGAVVGGADNCKVINCRANIDGAVHIGDGDYGSLGGIAGWAGNHTIIEACDVAVLGGGSMNSPQQLGGIAGYAVNGTRIDGCTVTGGPLTTRSGYGYRLGGIVGWAVGTENGAEDMNQPESRVTIQNCSVSADGTEAEKYQTSMNYCNGLVGVLYRSDLRSSTAENLYLRGNSYVAGAVGVAHGDSTVIDCHVRSVDVELTSAISYAGGFIGALYSFTNGGLTLPDKPSRIEDCSVTDARVVGYSEYVGGFAGGIYERNFVTNCHVESVEVAGRNYVGGFSGVIYNYSTITGCSVSKTARVTAQYYVGGFSGATYGYSNVAGCSVEDFAVTATRAGASSHAAGFSGWLYDSASLTDCYAIDGTVKGPHTHLAGLISEMTMSAVVNNCYAQVDVICDSSTALLYANIGGLIGTTGGSPTIGNSYATGNISARNTAGYVGGLIGYRVNTAKTTNCFATGTLDVPATSRYVGGLIGFNGGSQNISNCYFDITTVGNSGGVGAAGSWNGTNMANITPLTTTQMIAGDGPAGSFINFDYQDTAEEDGNRTSPWYIDVEATYPYLYYQYNGFSDAERDYSLGTVKYGDGSPMGKSRVDFTIQGPMPFAVQSAGAKWAYFPYTGRSMYPVASNAQTDVPATNAVPIYPIYSLGGISETGIVGFVSMPSVLKTSDRPVYQEDDPDTFTYVWDLIRYEITLANRSADYDWHVLELEDPLPPGVVLVPRTDVTVAYDDGPEIILSAGIPGVDAAPFYTYDDANRILTVYLDQTLYHIGASNSPNTAVVRFTAVPLPDAATIFEPDGTFTGDNIRNRGTVRGTLTEIDGSTTESYATSFDDRNRDPVLDAIPVVYDSNYDMDDMVTANDDLEIKDHCDTDGSDDHIVLPNDDPGNGDDYLGFSLADHVFSEWVYYNEAGTAIAVQPEDTLYGISRITVLFAEWDPVGPTFEFYKVDSAGQPLAGAVFELYIWRGAGEPGLTDPVTEADIADGNGNWKLVDTYTSAIDPETGEGLPVSMTFPETGTYQLIEAAAPTAYYRLKNQWQFTASVETDSPHTVSDPQKLEGLDEIVSVDIEKNSDDKWILTNYTALQLKFLKVSTPFLQNGSLESVPLAGAAFTLYAWAGTDTPDADALVTDETVAAGLWREHSSEVSQADGMVTFALTDYSHIYQLVETTAPDRFQLPTGQWRFEVENGSTLPQVIDTITAIPGADGQPPPAFRVMTDEHLNGKYDGELALVNFGAQSLPAMGGSGVEPYIFLGSLLFSLGILLLAVHRLNKKRKCLAAGQKHRNIRQQYVCKKQPASKRPKGR